MTESTPKNVVALRQRFRVAFGIESPEVRESASVSVGAEAFTFSFSFAGRREDTIWIASNISTFASDGAFSGASVSNDLEIMTLTVALATRAVNGIPLWKWLGVGIPDGVTISDPMFPGPAIHKRAVLLWANDFLRPAPDELTRLLNEEYTRVFEERINIRVNRPKTPEPRKLHCKNEECQYVLSVAVGKDGSEVEGDNYAHCPVCGTAAEYIVNLFGPDEDGADPLAE